MCFTCLLPPPSSRAVNGDRGTRQKLDDGETSSLPGTARPMTADCATISRALGIAFLGQKPNRRRRGSGNHPRIKSKVLTAKNGILRSAVTRGA